MNEEIVGIVVVMKEEMTEEIVGTVEGMIVVMKEEMIDLTDVNLTVLLVKRQLNKFFNNIELQLFF